MRGQKPIKAICDGMAASAAYLLASAADEIIISPTGYAGSIGVVARHVDFSAALASDGVKVTHIFAGAHKVDGNPYEPLPDAVREDWQSEIDGIYSDFLSAVATHRGISVDAVRKTQARTYRGHAAIDARLADRMGSTDQIIQELVALRTTAQSIPSGQTARANADDKGVLMSGNTQQGGQPAATNPTNPAAANAQAGVQAGAAISKADLDTAVATALAQGRAEGAAAERARIADVRAQSLPGHQALIEALAADGHTTGPQAASIVLAAERKLRETQASAEVNDAPKAVKTSAATDHGTPAKRLPNAAAAYGTLNRRAPAANAA
jgi:ClpP class serine protease